MINKYHTISLACPGTLDQSIKQRPQLGTSRLNSLMSFMILEMDAIILAQSCFGLLSSSGSEFH